MRPLVLTQILECAKSQEVKMKSDSSVHSEAGALAGIVPSVNLAAEPGRMDFYQRARSRNLAPLWRVLHGLVTDQPAPRCVPALWRYAEIRPYPVSYTHL